MAWTRFQIGLAFLMLITGSINTLAAKWADKSYAKGIDGGPSRQFDHPFLQAVGMFIGEFSCLIVFQIMRLVYKRRGTPMEIGNQQFNPLIFWPAALCDMTGTSLMYVGLNMTYASSFQMLRGAVMIFTGILSVTFLRRVIKPIQWSAMFIVVAGLVLVGLADIFFDSGEKKRDINTIITGDLLVIMAQVIAACQMVYEEKFVTKHDVPALQAVGWEGLFGACTLGCLLVPMYFIKVGYPISNDPDGRLENALDAFVQMGNNPIIIVATLGNVISIAFFNFSGISVTKEMSATTRMVLDSGRTIIIWAVSLAVQWQPFSVQQFFLQAAGFVLLLTGMCVYNEIICQPAYYRYRRGRIQDGEREPLINEETPVIQDRDAAYQGDYGTRQPGNAVDI